MITWMSENLNVPAQSIRLDCPFAEYGMDSLKVVEFTTALES